ncbi:hypothetical protein Syun_002472 [Stephania yunnanensis]|uniref:Uncharacterized protein n=1 Tax=Stephania yunnanensis TaxID=152371 RepID=A0AAP0Q776_9MAGN
MKSLDNESAPRFCNSPKQRWLGFLALHQKRRSQLAIDASIDRDRPPLQRFSVCNAMVLMLVIWTRICNLFEIAVVLIACGLQWIL